MPLPPFADKDKRPRREAIEDGDNTGAHDYPIYAELGRQRKS